MSGMRSTYTNVYSDYKYEWYEVYLHKCLLKTLRVIEDYRYEWYEVYLHEWYEIYLHKCLLRL